MSEKYYSEVYEIPLFNWERCLYGDFQYIRKETTEKFNRDDVKAFYAFYNKYIKQFGLGKEQEKYLKLKEDYIKIWIKYAETDDAFLINTLTKLEADIKKANPANNKGMTIGETLVWLTKWMGGAPINKMQTSLGFYKDLIKEYERANKKE